MLFKTAVTCLVKTTIIDSQTVISQTLSILAHIDHNAAQQHIN